MKGLVIDEPWIGKILRREKTWEMRKTACHQRGQVALIRKGSGLVMGVADVVDSRAPIATRGAYADAEPFHGIPPDRQERAFADGWTSPWVLAEARPLASPVRYQHPPGAVIWVNLGEAVASAIARQLDSAADEHLSPPPVAAGELSMARGEECSSPVPVPPSCRGHSPLPPSGGTTRRVVVTGGNIRNSHIYLPLDFFPEDTMGGRNKTEAAARAISVTFRPGMTIETDIDRTKRILRTRGPVGDFLARAGVQDGDAVLITRTAAYAYTIMKASDD